MYLVTSLFFTVLLLNQRSFPPLRLHISDCSTFCIVCDVPSVPVFCSDQLNVFLVWLQNFSFTLCFYPVAPIITGIILHFRFHIHCTPTHKLLYFSFYYYYYYYCCLTAQNVPLLAVQIWQQQGTGLSFNCCSCRFKLVQG